MLHGVIIGQCTLALQSMINGNLEYEAKSGAFDALWLLTRIKLTTAGVDLKANPSLWLHEQVLAFFIAQQGQNESDDN